MCTYNTITAQEEREYSEMEGSKRLFGNRWQGQKKTRKYVEETKSLSSKWDGDEAKAR